VTTQPLTPGHGRIEQAAAGCSSAKRRACHALAFIAGVAAASLAGPATAHHSFSAEFDNERPVQLTGKVTDMRWSNPHAWIFLDVEQSDGTVVNWALEMGGANGLIRRGWRREDLPAGTVLKVDGWQARNGTPTANISTVTFEDGRTLFAGTSNPSAARQQ
jgi:hypothetical protein